MTRKERLESLAEALMTCLTRMYEAEGYRISIGFMEGRFRIYVSFPGEGLGWSADIQAPEEARDSVVGGRVIRKTQAIVSDMSKIAEMD